MGASLGDLDNHPAIPEHYGQYPEGIFSNSLPLFSPVGGMGNTTSLQYCSWFYAACQGLYWRTVERPRSERALSAARFLFHVDGALRTLCIPSRGH